MENKFGGGDEEADAILASLKRAKEAHHKTKQRPSPDEKEDKEQDDGNQAADQADRS